jgi:hypothetical protein
MSWLRMSWREIAASAFLLALVQASNAAEIKANRSPYSPIAPYYVEIEGKIELYDNIAFENAVRSPGQFIVYLNSPGGNLQAALLIGHLIHERGYITVAKKNIWWGMRCPNGQDRNGCLDICASACAAIWLAGKQRFVEPGVHLGFHASSLNGQPSNDGDQIVREYYRDLSIRNDTIEALLSYGPNSMIWMTREMTEALGVKSQPWEVKPFHDHPLGPSDPPEKPFWKYPNQGPPVRAETPSLKLGCLGSDLECEGKLRIWDYRDFTRGGT